MRAENNETDRAQSGETNAMAAIAQPLATLPATPDRKTLRMCHTATVKRIPIRTGSKLKRCRISAGPEDCAVRDDRSHFVPLSRRKRASFHRDMKHQESGTGGEGKGDTKLHCSFFLDRGLL